MSAHRAANSWRGFVVGLGVAILVAFLVAIGMLSERKFAGAVATGLAGSAASVGIAFAFIGWKRREDAAARMRPQLSCHPQPVRYLGWHGTVHTFVFSSNSFANAFAAANQRKLVR
jgi:hypothetical protein